MTDPYAWLPKCLCGHPMHVHKPGTAGGQQVRGACSPTCGCKRYRSPGTVRELRCPTCGTPWDPIEAARKEHADG